MGRGASAAPFDSRPGFHYSNFALAVNYCLIPGRNDGEGAAEGVAACGQLGRVE